MRVSHMLGDFIPQSKPAAQIIVAAFVDSIGTGIYIAGMSLFLIRHVGLESVEVGIGLSIAGLSAFVSKLPAGFIAETWGPRRVLVIAHLARAACFIGLAFVANAPAYFLMSAAVGLFQGPAYPLTQAIVGSAVSDANRVQTLALVRTTQNVAIMFGTLVASFLLLVDSVWAYRAIMLANAATFVAAALLIACINLRRHIGSSRKIAPFSILRPVCDLPYLGMTVTSGIMSVYINVLVVGVPLWALALEVPASIVPLLLTLNAVLAIILQVPASRGARGARGGQRTLVGAAVLLALGFVLLALAGFLEIGWLVITTLFFSVAMLTLGEVAHSIGEWEVAYRYAPPEGRALYLSSFSLGQAAMSIAGPIIVTAAVVPIGGLGWFALGGAMLMCWPLAVGLLKIMERRLVEAAKSESGDI